MGVKYFHFTLGPVQSFVAQARRTKDFWAGSFLLAYLSGVAMAATRQQGGAILFPLPDQEFLDAITGNKRGGPKQGNIPNRFKAEVPDSFQPREIVDTVREVWAALAEKVWEQDLSDYEDTVTRTIWDRQVNGFWEMSWALSPDGSAADLLDRRKNWRTYIAQDEPGQKCAIMAGIQELSGEEAAQSKAQKAFWKTLRASKKSFDFDLGENERLSALAFIKRRFIRYFGDFRYQSKTIEAHGWGLSSNVPSVALLAAAPWLANVASHPKMIDLIEAAKGLGATEMPLSQLRMLRESKNSEVFRLDGAILFDTLLDNRNIYPDESVANRAKAALRPLYVDERPSPFYAVLMMDGDHLGKQMSDADKQEGISESLQKFTASVEGIVDEYSGFLIYAGGDDVLAVLPLETALSCAAKLRARYEEVFRKHPTIETSISAAIVYSHIKNPLHAVLHDIHELLDDVAKERTGRNAIAIETLKPGGVQQIWSKKWAEALDENGEVLLEKLALAYRRQSEGGQFSSGFFYRIREIMEIVEGIGSFEDRKRLLAVEYRAGTSIKQEDAEKIIDPLLKQCEQNDPDDIGRKIISANAALIVRFLAQKGVER